MNAGFRKGLVRSFIKDINDLQALTGMDFSD